MSALAATNGSYTLVYTNLTDMSVQEFINTNVTVTIQINNTLSTTELYNLTLEVPTNISATVNGSLSFTDISLAPNATTYFNVTVLANATGNYFIYIIATLSNDSTVILNSSDDVVAVNLTALDATAPTATLITPANRNASNNPTVTLNFTVSDNYDSIVSFSVFVDGVVNVTGTSANNTANTTTTLWLADGNHSLVVQATDSSGNKANSTINNITIDTTTPAIVITSPLNQTLASATQEFLFNATDNLDTSLSYVVYTNGTQTMTGAATNNTLTSVNLSLSTGEYAITIRVSDNLNNTINTTINVTVDGVEPVISSVVINNFTVSSGSTLQLNTSDGRIILNWTITELNLSIGNVSLNSVLVHTNATNGTRNFTRVLEGGKHILKLAAKDISGNIDIVTFYVKINKQVNTTAAFARTTATLGATLNGVVLTAGSTDLSANITYLNQTLNLTYDIDAGVRAIVEIPNFDGLSANWNESGNFAVDIDTTGTQADAARARGAQLRSMVLFRNINRFLNETDFTIARLTFNTSLTTNDSVFYIADDDGTDIYRIDQCTSNGIPSAVADDEDACYTNTTANFTIHAPHLSGGGIGNDTKGPAISSVSNSSIATTSATISWTTDETANSSINLSTAGTITQQGSSSLTISHSIDVLGLESSTTYYYNVTSCDPAGNCNSSGPYTFTTAAASSTTSSSSGGGGGGGGGGAFSTPIISTAGTKVTLTTYGKYTFKLADNSEHTLTLVKLTDTQASFKLASNPIEFTLTQGETKSLDITGDNVADLAIELLTLRQNSAYVELTRLSGSASTTTAPTSTTPQTVQGQTQDETVEQPVEEDTTPTASPTQQEPAEKSVNTEEESARWPWIILVTILLLGIFVTWALKTGRITLD